MELLTLKMVAAISLFVLSLISGLTPVRLWLEKPSHASLPIGEAFAGGIFLGAALFHMLPTAQLEFSKILANQDYPYANLICAFGFSILLLLEKIVSMLTKKRTTNHSLAVAYVLLAVLSLHALSEGIALGINVTLTNTLIIFIAIIVHKMSESFALAASLSKSGIMLRSAKTIFILFSLATPIGIALGVITNYEIASSAGLLWQGIFNAFAAGTFLYIATLHNLHHHHHADHPHAFYMYEFVALIIGMLLMAGLAFWV